MSLIETHKKQVYVYINWWKYCDPKCKGPNFVFSQGVIA